ncbi:DNA alkylation repair protein [Enhygromyxa salina]|nr:DNA alkylation repair protein [Enhygromyxa salina]
MKELEAGGSAARIALCKRLGLDGPTFGTSYAALKALDKKVADDTELALKLWASGNHDARVFACWIVEEKSITMKLLDTWAKDTSSRALGLELATLTAFSRHASRQSRKWRKAKDDVRCGMGWIVVGLLATQPDRSAEEGGITDDELRVCLEEIEAKIHSAQNGTKSNMNSALIGIGCRMSTSKAALAVAKRVGKVDVDQGNRSCKTRVPLDEIKKTIAHYEKKGKTPAEGAAGLRRRHC